MSRIADLLLGRRDAVANPVRMVGLPTDGGFNTSVTSTTVLGLSAVIRCLDILTNAVSQLEWYERRGTLDLPLSRLVARPHPDMTRRDWTSFIVASLALWDRAYLLPTGGEDSEGVPINLLPLDPSVVAPATVRKGLQLVSPLPSADFWVGTALVPGDNLIILNRSPIPGISESAMGIIRLFRTKFSEALAADGYSSRYWQAGGPMDRALETDANIPDTLAQSLSDRWAERRQKGPDHWPVLSGGLKAKQYGVDPTAQSAVEARKELVADIARALGVPTDKVNAPAGDSETYKSSEPANLDLVRFTLRNYIGAIEDAISDQLPRGRRLYMDIWPLVAPPMATLGQYYQLATGGKAWMTPDEVREKSGLPPVESPDELNPPAPVPATSPQMTPQMTPQMAGGQRNG